MLRLGVLVSGRGSNLQALLDSISRRELPCEVAIVVSNHAEAQAVTRATSQGIPAKVIPRGRFGSRIDQQMAIADELEQHEVELVVLAGFDRVLCAEFVRRFTDRIINVHPSLLPAFGGGLHAQAEALKYGAKITGCTVHFVTEDVDCGPIILQRAVPILDDDTPQSLAARILAEEHLILPEAIRLFAMGKLSIEGRRVRAIPPSQIRRSIADR